MKNRYEFIVGLLNNKRLTLHQRERILSLCAGELERNGFDKEELLERIEKIEKQLLIDSKSTSKTHGLKRVRKMSLQLYSPESNPLAGSGILVEDLLTDESKPRQEEKNHEDVVIPSPSFLTRTTHEKLTGNILRRRKKVDSKSDPELLNMLTNNFESVTKKNNSPEPISAEIPKRYSQDSNSSLPLYKDPKDLRGFLLRINQDKVLKYVCHAIDDESVVNNINELCKTEQYSLIEHLKLIKKRYDEIAENSEISKNIKTLIKVYLTGKDYLGRSEVWSEDKIPVSWGCKDMMNWAQQNPNMVPNPGDNFKEKYQYNGFEFRPFHVKRGGRMVANFTDLVLHFKHLFHIRSDNALKTMLELTNTQKGWGNRAKIKFNEKRFPINIELFTDVDKLLQSYNSIIQMFIKYHESVDQKRPTIELSFYQEGDHAVLTIHDLNSTYGKTVKDVKRGMGDEHEKLIHKINGICDLFLKADFGDGERAKINLWDGRPWEEEILKEEFRGVQYILRFSK